MELSGGTLTMSNDVASYLIGFAQPSAKIQVD
jgi:hypothetical protein